MYSRKLFTRRYLAALTLIGAVLAGSFAAVMHRLKENQNDGYIINTAGQQRMLSQRIALLALETVNTPSKAKQAEFVAKLKYAADQMAKNHAVLVSGHRSASTSAEALGGTLTYQPLKDGSRFTLTWPVQESQDHG